MRYQIEYIGYAYNNTQKYKTTLTEIGSIIKESPKQIILDNGKYKTRINKTKIIELKELN